jgi:hypothetical protein
MSRPRQHRPIVTSLILAAAALAAGRARADYTLTTIDVPGARSTRAWGSTTPARSWGATRTTPW